MIAKHILICQHRALNTPRVVVMYVCTLYSYRKYFTALPISNSNHFVPESFDDDEDDEDDGGFN